MQSNRPPLLARLERECPEWLPRVRPHPAGRGKGPTFLLLLPSRDARPDAEVAFEKGEALVRVGRHEQLFVWAPEEAEDATGEVIAYLERITRPDVSVDTLRDGIAALTGEQKELLARVDELLRERGAVSDVRFAGPPSERHAALTLLLPPERRLDVTIRIGADAFDLDGNGALLQLCRVDYGDEGPAWIRGCVSVLRALLADELVLRTRRTLLGRRVGAIRVPDASGGAVWNGEALAYLGLGRTRRFRRWWSTT